MLIETLSLRGAIPPYIMRLIVALNRHRVSDRIVELGKESYLERLLKFVLCGFCCCSWDNTKYCHRNFLAAILQIAGFFEWSVSNSISDFFKLSKELPHDVFSNTPPLLILFSENISLKTHFLGLSVSVYRFSLQNNMDNQHCMMDGLKHQREVLSDDADGSTLRRFFPDRLFIPDCLGCIPHILHLLFGNLGKKNKNLSDFVEKINSTSAICNSSLLKGLFKKRCPRYMPIRWKSLLQNVEWLDEESPVIVSFFQTAPFSSPTSPVSNSSSSSFLALSLPFAASSSASSRASVMSLLSQSASSSFSSTVSSSPFSKLPSPPRFSPLFSPASPSPASSISPASTSHPSEFFARLHLFRAMLERFTTLINIFEAPDTSFAVASPVLINGILDMYEVFCCIPPAFADLLEICDDLVEMVYDYTLGGKDGGAYVLSNALTVGGREDIRRNNINAYIAHRLADIAAKGGRSEFIDNLGKKTGASASSSFLASSSSSASSISSEHSQAAVHAAISTFPSSSTRPSSSPSTASFARHKQAYIAAPRREASAPLSGMQTCLFS
jgi:hypothetical protein